MRSANHTGAREGAAPGRVGDLARRFGTPLYVYDFDRMGRQLEKLRDAVPGRFDLYFAVKANPSLGVLRFFAQRGLGADVASRGELEAAREAGFPPRRIVFAGPGKSDEDLEAAVGAEILGINVEGPRELARLSRAGARRRERVPVQLRLNPGFGTDDRGEILGGTGAGKFGVDLGTAEELLEASGGLPGVELQGFHVCNASNVTDAGALVDHADRTLRLASELAARHGRPLEVVDMGGGFGVAYGAGESPLPLGELRDGLRSVAERADRDPRLSGARLLFEPGRFLVADAGRYVTRVLEVKACRGRIHVLVDGGVHHFLRPALYEARHPVELVASDASTRPRREVQIGGPLCTARDVLARSVRMPEPRPGDLVVFGKTGGYGYTESMLLFLSHPWPAEVGLRGEEAELLRGPVSPRELLQRQRVPGFLDEERESNPVGNPDRGFGGGRAIPEEADRRSAAGSPARCAGDGRGDAAGEHG